MTAVHRGKRKAPTIADLKSRLPQGATLFGQGIPGFNRVV